MNIHLYLYEYKLIFLYFFFCFILVLFILGFSQILASRNENLEKLSAYECGFEPMMSSRTRFDISFVFVAILFLIFDIELIFLIPWVLYIGKISFGGYCVMLFFLFLIMFGFLIEWTRGLLDWDVEQ
jgi:NADH:ubiquinone oxidoreductase subunit 3 (subunit A)